jgi:hypothetical protein
LADQKLLEIGTERNGTEMNRANTGGGQVKSATLISRILKTFAHINNM